MFSYIRKLPVHNSLIFLSSLTISFPSTSKMLFEFKPLLEKNGLTHLQKALLAVTFLTFVLLKYFSLV